jgi:hypothetical protein
MSETYRLYNDHKGGVDRADQFASLYLYNHKKARWTLAILFYLFKVGFANTWILWKEKNQKDDCQRIMIEILIEQICIKYPRDPCNRPEENTSFSSDYDDEASCFASDTEPFLEDFLVSTNLPEISDMLAMCSQ